MGKSYDAIVIGAGHNGLVAAACLARGGLRVLVAERRELAGGSTVTEEFAPGFKADTGAHRIGELDPAVLKALNLEGLGLEIVRPDPSVTAPLHDGRFLSLWRDASASAESIGRFSPRDGERWPAFTAHLARLAGLLGSIYSLPTPTLPNTSFGDLRTLLHIGHRFRKLGARDMMEVLRTLPMTVADLLDDWFETDVLKGTLGALGITGAFQGPMAAGTAYLLLHQRVGCTDGAGRSTALVRGGVGNLTRILVQAARKYGVEIRTQAEVERIVVKNGTADAVVLSNGDELTSTYVVSNADPRRTMLHMVGPAELSPEDTRKLNNIKFRGACAKVHLALDRLPEFGCFSGSGDAHLRGAISISPSLEYLERAYDDAKHGGVSRAPYLEVTIPTLIDPTMAPADRHVMSIFAQYAPYHLEGGWNDTRRAELGDTVIATLAQFASHLETSILHMHVCTPRDLETTFGLSEGSIYHGEMSLDQLYFMRPVPGWIRHRTPIRRLYMCGAGTHPGGGVTGTPGYHAAQEVLRDAKRER